MTTTDRALALRTRTITTLLWRSPALTPILARFARTRSCPGLAMNDKVREHIRDRQMHEPRQ